MSDFSFNVASSNKPISNSNKTKSKKQTARKVIDGVIKYKDGVTHVQLNSPNDILIPLDAKSASIKGLKVIYTGINSFCYRIELVDSLRINSAKGQHKYREDISVIGYLNDNYTFRVTRVVK